MKAGIRERKDLYLVEKKGQLHCQEHALISRGDFCPHLEDNQTGTDFRIGDLSLATPLSPDQRGEVSKEIKERIKQELADRPFRNRMPLCPLLLEGKEL